MNTDGYGQHTASQVITDTAARVRPRGPIVAAMKAVQVRSLHPLEALAQLATAGEAGIDAVLATLRTSAVPEHWDRDWLAAASYVLTTLARSDADRANAQMLQAALGGHALPMPDHPVDPYQGVPSATQTEFDIVFAGPWNRTGGPQKSMLAEIAALRGQGLRLGAMHLDAWRFMRKEEPVIIDALRDLAAAGELTILRPLDEATTDVLLVRYPPVLEFAPISLSIRAQRVIVMTNQAPAERDGSDRRYDVRDVDRRASTLFDSTPYWLPQGPMVRATIENEVSADRLLPFDNPGIVVPEAYATIARSARTDRIVYGRHSRDDATKWPGDRKTLLAAYPQGRGFEFRTMGGVRSPLRVLRTRLQRKFGKPARLPSSWVSLDADAMPVPEFLCSIDYFVYYAHPDQYEAFGRVLLEAIASGLVTITEPRFASTFGDAAIYVEPREVRRTLRRFHRDPEAYRNQSALALQRTREHFSPERFREVVALLRALPSTPAA